MYTIRKKNIVGGLNSVKWEQDTSFISNTLADSLAIPTSWSPGLSDLNVYKFLTNNTSEITVNEGPSSGTTFPNWWSFVDNETHILFPDKKYIEELSASRITLTQIKRVPGSSPAVFKKHKWVYLIKL